MAVSISPQQLKAFNTIISRQGITKDAKEAMIAEATGGRATSSKDLYFSEAQELISALNKTAPVIASGAKQSKGEKMRRNIIAMAHEMGWKLDNGKADMERVNAWCCKQFGKKKLDDYTYSELPKLVYAFKQVYNHFLKHI